MMDNFPTFYMVVGLPGSGKSTFCKSRLEYMSHIKHISSDDIRQELFNNVNNQDNNDKVFYEMEQRTLQELDKGNSVFYDATNLNYKNRIKIISKLPSYVIKVCYIIWEPLEVCVERDSKRKRSVSKKVIKNMLKTFNAPYFDEGYSRIYVCDSFGSRISSYKQFPKYMDMNIPNDNPHHSTSTIQEHCEKCHSYIKSDNEEVRIAAMYHDIGKPYTKSFF